MSYHQGDQSASEKIAFIFFSGTDRLSQMTYIL